MADNEYVRFKVLTDHCLIGLQPFSETEFTKPTLAFKRWISARSYCVRVKIGGKSHRAAGGMPALILHGLGMITYIRNLIFKPQLRNSSIFY